MLVPSKYIVLPRDVCGCDFMTRKYSENIGPVDDTDATSLTPTHGLRSHASLMERERRASQCSVRRIL